MKILIVSGFLGAGKTTFIKSLIQHTDIRPVVMENEYGENNIDAQALSEANAADQELKILEFMEGCVCCSMKDRFVNSVLAIFSGINPPYLIVEPTGVGRLSSILSNLQPILHENISLLKPVVVLSPAGYDRSMAAWPELYRDQVANAQTVIFSKCENSTAEELSETVRKIREINPHAEIVDRHYNGMDNHWWRSLVDLPAEAQAVVATDETADPFTQVSLHQARLQHPAELILLLEDCLRGAFGMVARAKGTIPVGSDHLRFDLADQMYLISGAEEPSNQCVFIGQMLDGEQLCRRMGTTLEQEGIETGIRIRPRR